MFVMGFYLLQDDIHDKLNKVWSHFFWVKENGKQMYHMVSWDNIYQPKEVGGLGVINTKIMNWCLMTKWARNILTGQGGLWLDIFTRKYLVQGAVEFRRNIKLSQFARDVRKVQPLLRLGTKFILHNGKATCFWLDIWCDDDRFRDLFLSRFAIATHQDAKVANIWRHGQWAPQFRRSLGDTKNIEWVSLREKLRGYQLEQGRDEVVWRLEPSGLFSTGSLYREIFKSLTPCDLFGLWKARLSAKIKIFLW